MDRRTFLAGTGAVIVAAPLVAGAQQAAKVARLGDLMVGRQGLTDYYLLQGLREPGYVEGRNLVIEYRYAEGKQERFPVLKGYLHRDRASRASAVNHLGNL